MKVKPPAEAQRAADLIVKFFGHNGAAEFFADDKFAEVAESVASETWSQTARRLGEITQADPRERVVLALVLQELADLDAGGADTSVEASQG